MKVEALQNPSAPEVPPPGLVSDAGFSSDFEAAETHRRSHGEAWRERLICLVLSALLGAALTWFYFERRAMPDQVALGHAVQIKPGFWNGTAINAHRLKDYPELFPPRDSGPLWLWLGNSQLHSINQVREQDEIAPALASARVGLPVFGLTLPNASMRELYLITGWALSRSQPQWLILAVSFDKMREYDIRTGFDKLVDEPSRDLVREGPTGRLILDQLDSEQQAERKTDLQGTSRWGFSPQEVTEKALNDRLTAASKVWRERDQMYATAVEDLYRLRNLVFRIKSNTKRPVIASRVEGNMNALAELLDLCKKRGVEVLVYVAPTRWDVEPPYFLDKYEAWKPELKSLVEQHGAYYADLDKIVPDQYWGTVNEQVDFMHFQGPGHKILAERVCEEIAKHEPQQKAEGKN
jgi:hypothetical protein